VLTASGLAETVANFDLDAILSGTSHEQNASAVSSVANATTDAESA
jgi:hypothetical protein